MAISEDKNRLYVDSSRKPGITLRQIAQCLRDFRVTKLGTDLGLLCTSPNINKWAKRKPVRSSDIACKEETYKADDGWCGLDITSALVSENADVSAIGSKYDGKDNGWAYAAPRGRGHDEWFRTLDFNGYNHKASPFVSQMVVPAEWAKSEGAFTANVLFAEDNEDSLSYRDIEAMKGFYLGLALVGNGATRRCTAETTIGESGMGVSLDPASLADGSYKAFPFIADRRIDANDGLVETRIYTLPNNKGVAVEIISDSIAVMLVAVKDIIRSRIEYTIKVTNNVTAPRTLKNNVVRLRYDDKAYDDILVANEVSENLPDFMVEGKSEHSQSGTFSVTDATLFEHPRLWVWLDGGKYVRDAIPMQDTTLE